MQQLEKSYALKHPKDWNVENIGKYVNILSGEYFAYNEFVDEGIPVLKIDNVMYGQIDWTNKTYLPTKYLSSHDRFVLYQGDIVLALNRPITNNQVKVAIIRKKDTPSILYQRVGKFEFIPNDDLDKKFFFIYLMSPFFKKTISKSLVGSDQPYVKTTELIKKKFLKPSLKEQQKISSILSNVDELIQKTVQIIEQTQRLKKGLMQRLLTKGIGYTKFKKINFNSLNLLIPENWKYCKMKTLSALSEDAILTGPFGSMLHSYDYVKEGTPLILIKNIQNGKINDNDIPKITQKDVERLARYRVREGDIVFSRVGRVGSAALIEKKHNGWLISGQTLRIRFDSPNVNSQFINYFIKLDIFQKILKAGMLGSTRDSINTTILENSPVLLPPIEEQNKIVSRIFNIDNILEKNEKILLHLQNLKKGLMQQLLTGKIRVKV